MIPISTQAGLLRYVGQQGGGAPHSDGVRTRLAGGTYMAGKIKFQSVTSMSTELKTIKMFFFRILKCVNLRFSALLLGILCSKNILRLKL